MSNTKNVPGYLSLVLKVLTRAQKLGLTVQREMSKKSTLPENNGFCFVAVDGGDACLIIPKHAGAVKWCHLHIDWKGEAGYIGPVDTHGAVVCQVDPSQIDIDLLLSRLSGANRPDKKKSSKAASQATSEMLALLQTIGLPSQESEEDEDAVDGQFEESVEVQSELQ